MKDGWRILTLLPLGLALNACASQTPSAQVPNQPPAPPSAMASEQSDTDQNRVPNEYLVSVNADSDAPALLQQLFADQGVLSVKRLMKNLYWIKVARDPGPKAMAALANDHPEIRYVEPNRIIKLPPPPVEKPGIPTPQ